MAQRDMLLWQHLKVLETVQSCCGMRPAYPCCPWHWVCEEIADGLQAMALQCVERLVVDSRKELSIGRLAVAAADSERPRLLLSWHKLVAEALPFCSEHLVGLSTSDGCRVAVKLSPVHPCVGDAYAVAVLFLIAERAAVQAVVPLHYS